MPTIFEKQFDDLSRTIRFTVRRMHIRVRAYIRKLLFPLYLFPLKLFTYTTYYVVVFSFAFIIALLKVLRDAVIFPFTSLKNFLKTAFLSAIVLYMVASLFVITDYMRTQYGWYDKFLCSFGVREKLQSSVVRVVGGTSEGSGFFIESDQVMTNFHVIADEPSPKIILPNGQFITPVSIVGDPDLDLAVMYTHKEYDDFVLPLPRWVKLSDDEPVLAAGYPLGTDLTGDATLLRGRFFDFRKSSQMPIEYLQTDISLVQGMSGGPLVDQCGNVMGINTIGLAGLSLFINADWAQSLLPTFTNQHITKIDVDPSRSPEDAVRAYYTYLKARKMKEGFDLLSWEYLKKTNFEEWTARFTDIIDVTVITAEPVEDEENTVFVKFITKNWNNREATKHFYEGTWEMVFEDGVYKIVRGAIEEVEKPEWDWFW